MSNQQPRIALGAKALIENLSRGSNTRSVIGKKRMRVISRLLIGTVLHGAIGGVFWSHSGSATAFSAMLQDAPMIAPTGGPTPGGPMPPPGTPGAPGTPGGPPVPGAPAGAPPAAGAPTEPIVKRPTTPPEPPNKKEFDVKPDEQGMVEFQFRNQSWPDILKWLAETSHVSLDWQELPSDFLNIATQKKQSLEETRDQINRHLLARGFTMLELDGVIQVVKTAGVNVSLVPKVTPKELANLPPNRFVRTSFTLATLIAKDCVAEFKPMLSANGVLTALGATNRLEAMDSAANLSELSRVIQEEESEESVDNLAKEFELKYVRAVEVREQLMSFLGVESKAKKESSGRQSPQEMMMQQQQMQMEMQMQMQRANQPGGGQPQQGKDIYLVANMRRNSIIAHAPPDKMAIISAFLKRVDVPNENAANMQRLEARMKPYRLSSLDPKQFIMSISELDALEPTTRLIPDEKNKAIIAYASLSDHLIISQTIERLDGSARDFEVIQLRRLKAEDVAGTIKFLMVGEEKKTDNNRRSRFYYYDPYSMGNDEDKNNSNDTFRIGSNVHDNQILLWANETEIQEVTKLLEKLGEVPPTGGERSKVRLVDATRSAETKAYLERLQQAWSKISDTPLKLPAVTEFEPDTSPLDHLKNETKSENSKNGLPTIEPVEVDEKQDSSDESKPKSKGSKTSELDASSPLETLNRYASVSDGSNSPSKRISSVMGRLISSSDAPKKSTSADDNEDGANVDIPNEISSVAVSAPRGDVPNAGAPNIEIRFDEKGNLILAGEDLDALDRLESMMMANIPPQRKYSVFYIAHTKPSWIELNLKDYFKEEEKEEKSNPFFSWYFGEEDTSKNDSSREAQLGKSRKLKFISDSDTQSIVVMGADDQQLKTIESLIKLWDVPQKTSKQKLRYSKLVRVEHSKANSIVEAIKDAYRDLLSTNDKAFQKDGKDGKGEAKHDEASASVTATGGMSYNFTGRLSMGIEPLTNSIIVTAEGEELLKLVVDMIKDLDVAAQPSGAVQMIQLGGTNSTAMERALKAMMGRKTDNQPGAPGQPPQQGGMPTPGQVTPPAQNGNFGVNGSSSPSTKTND